jgi:ribosome-binding factor A
VADNVLWIVTDDQMRSTLPTMHAVSRRLVAKGMTLKFAPELRFMLDETFDRMDATRRLFSDERVRRDVDQQSDDARDDDAQMG